MNGGEVNAEQKRGGESFNLTPDPRVLVALARTPLQPLDALCELIDNSLDSFHMAELRGEPVANPIVVVEVPRPSEVDHASGRVLVRDNGPGMDRESAERSIRAGYTSNNPFDTLGLFGMGFNIATAKFGRITEFTTARRQDTEALHVVIDLDELVSSGDYLVPVGSVAKPEDMESGTQIIVKSWWPAGDTNAGFVARLARYSDNMIRRELGRRYATVLRKKDVRIVVNGQPCPAFEHCAWGDSRYVDRQGWGKIPAVFRLDEAIGNQKRCVQCGAVVEDVSGECPRCGSSGIRTVEQRVTGWIGIQRFDDATEYGIDLIRNGRAIRVAEKSAFFEWTDDLRRTLKDYPIDQQYGRIVGEIELNHVPVDFLKQDFQRSSPEWLAVMAYIRGESSLQPNQPGADGNRSPLFKLYQGYRRVRRPGFQDMYMGFWSAETNGPKRISRDEERALFQRFLAREPGYYDDAEWWKLVEQAEQRPLPAVVYCSQGHQNLETDEICQVCGDVLKGKDCINPSCDAVLPASALVCDICGLPQTPVVKEPWRCKVCGTINDPELPGCKACGKPRGAENPLSRDHLLTISHRDDELSINGYGVALVSGDRVPVPTIDTYVVEGHLVNTEGEMLPAVVFRGERTDIFIDLEHSVFRTTGTSPENVVASEAAAYLLVANQSVAGQDRYKGQFNQADLEWRVLQERWGDRIEESPDSVRAEVSKLFDIVRDRMPFLLADVSKDILSEFDEVEEVRWVERAIARGVGIDALSDLKASGSFLSFVDESTVAALVVRYPERFFDGGLWDVPYTCYDETIPTATVERAQRTIREQYSNCLRDVAQYMGYTDPHPLLTSKAHSAVRYLGLGIT